MLKFNLKVNKEKRKIICCNFPLKRFKQKNGKKIFIRFFFKFFNFKPCRKTVST